MPQAQPQTKSKTTTARSLSPSDIDKRIRFHDDLQIMETDFSGLHLYDSHDVNVFYDRLEERIHNSGEDQWFFLVNYSGSKIDPDAWFAFSRRGKALNMAHSMGSVRYDVSEATRRQIERDAGTDAFDANLFADRAGAVERLKSMPSTRAAKIHHSPNYTRADFEARVSFLDAGEIMEIDLSDLTLYHGRDVDDLYDCLQDLIEVSGRRWYFLVNYNNCRIMPEAWVQFAKRGKDLNLGGSLGSVRYETGADTEDEIRLRAQSQGFRPNVRNTRAEAMARIAEMKTEDGG
jgi:hypothetical protein